MTTNDSQVRTTLKRTLTYRHQVNVYLPIICMVALIFNGIMLTLFLVDTDSSTLLLGSPIAHAMTWILGNVYLAALIAASIRQSRLAIHVSPQELVIQESANSSVKIDYQDIEKLEIKKMMKFSSWFYVILKSGKKFRFTSALERADYILDSIVSQRPDLENKEEILQFRRQAVSQDHSASRFFDLLKDRKYLALKLAGTPLFLALLDCVANQMSLFPNPTINVLIYSFSLWFFMGLFVVSFIHQVVEYKISTAFEKIAFSDPTNFSRDLANEKALTLLGHKVFFCFISALYLVKFLLLQNS